VYYRREGSGAVELILNDLGRPILCLVDIQAVAPTCDRAVPGARKSRQIVARSATSLYVRGSAGAQSTRGTEGQACAAVGMRVRTRR